jgi:hypothetical protein
LDFRFRSASSRRRITAAVAGAMQPVTSMRMPDRWKWIVRATGCVDIFDQTSKDSGGALDPGIEARDSIEEIVKAGT